MRVFGFVSILSLVNLLSGQDSLSVEIQGDVYIIVEHMPEFPGGQLEFHKSVINEISPPIVNKGKRIKGRVYVQFIVDAEGRMKDFKISKGIGEIYDQEVLRAFNEIAKSAKWKPGTHKGQKVDVKMILPIFFN